MPIVLPAAMFEGEMATSAPNGVAWLLEHPRTLLWWRIGSLLLLIVGFHFDLLAS
ncbi:hypothetical protein AB0H88_19360 [Nonomuraea sp. NPDC050680]|uniref:hypothetical protein n=1 Tax=Nonomuraea sp. NPDC050680 TaxID=3154630 RepID=UPI00340BEAEA